MLPAPTRPIDLGTALPRVLIIDDSAVARAVLSRMVAEGGTFEVAAAVPDVRRGLAFLADASVDAILLDIEMPGVDGLTGLPDLLAASGGAKVLIVSSSCGDGAAASIQALALGAADTLVKPGGGSIMGRFARDLQERLVRLIEPAATVVAPPPTPAARDGAFDVVAIGASTGGIHALSTALRRLPADFRCPILLTQHLPAAFTPYFAAQVALIAGRPCDVAEDGMAVRPGRVMIAPGDAHLLVIGSPGGSAAVRLSREKVPNGNLPSVDPMFASLARVYGTQVLAIMLSGMGRDGLDGARTIHAAGGTVIAQDQPSSVVWGMPGAVAGAGIASALLPPEAIGDVLAGRRGW